MLTRSRNANRLNLDLSRAKVAFDYGSSLHIEPITPGARTAELATYHVCTEADLNIAISKKSARGAISDSNIERLRASWKLKRINENQDPASRHLMIRADLAEKRALEEMNGIDRLFVPPNSAAPHPDSFPIEPAFLFTVTDGGTVEGLGGMQTIVSEGQLIPVDVDESDAADGAPQSRYAIACPKLHPELKHVYSRTYTREIEGVNWMGFCDKYEPVRTEDPASFLETTDDV